MTEEPLSPEEAMKMFDRADHEKRHKQWEGSVKAQLETSGRGKATYAMRKFEPLLLALGMLMILGGCPMYEAYKSGSTAIYKKVVGGYENGEIWYLDKIVGHTEDPPGSSVPKTCLGALLFLIGGVLVFFEVSKWTLGSKFRPKWLDSKFRPK